MSEEPDSEVWLRRDWQHQGKTCKRMIGGGWPHNNDYCKQWEGEWWSWQYQLLLLPQLLQCNRNYKLHERLAPKVDKQQRIALPPTTIATNASSVSPPSYVQHASAIGIDSSWRMMQKVVDNNLQQSCHMIILMVPQAVLMTTSSKCYQRSTRKLNSWAAAGRTSQGRTARVLVNPRYVTAVIKPTRENSMNLLLAGNFDNWVCGKHCSSDTLPSTSEFTDCQYLPQSIGCAGRNHHTAAAVCCGCFIIVFASQLEWSF